MTKKPPKIARWILCRLRNKFDHESLIGDYDEIFQTRYEKRGHVKAKIWYWIQILKTVSSFFNNLIHWDGTMFKNYLKIAVRNMKNNGLNTSINILGLSIAFGFCILVFSFVRDEYTYDRFHNNADCIYEIISKSKFGNDYFYTGTQPALGATLPGQFPEIKTAARITRDEYVVKYKDRIFTEKFISADPDFFEVFTFPLEAGNSENPLTDLNSIIISPQTAKKYFGSENPIGKTMTVKIKDKFDTFTVSGVLKKVPGNSSLKSDFIINIKNTYGKKLDEWTTWGGPSVFVLLEKKEQAQSLRNKFPSTINKHLHEKGLAKESGYVLFPLTDYHLNSVFSGVLKSPSKKIYSYILTGIAVLVLIIAISNFVNLSVGVSSSRLKEIGLRKVLGAQKKQLVRQFLFESVLLSFFSAAAGFFLAFLFLPSFNMISQKTLSFYYILNWKYSGGLFGLIIFTGIAAGVYPAVVLSRFVAVDLFKKVFRFTGKNLFSRVMIVLQFMISIFFIILTIIILNQYSFMLNSKLGIESDHVIVVELSENSSNSGATKAIFTNLKNHLLSDNSILSLSASHSKYDMFSASVGIDKNKNRVILGINWIDYDYLKFFGIKLIDGRYFSKDRPSDSENKIIVNKTFVERFEVESPVGKKLSNIFPTTRRDAEIIGVVEDFHYQSLHNEIWPTYLTISEDMGYKYVYIRIKGENVQNTVSMIKNEFKSIAPNLPFIYSFIDDEIAATYENEKRYGKMFSFVSFFAILIASAGLFGLTALAVIRRTKEISIRKVFGASIPRILKLISKEFLILVIIGNIFSWPIAYYVANSWLQNFAYKIKISSFPFIIAGIAAFVIALFTISIQTIKAARKNPVDTLRYE